MRIIEEKIIKTFIECMNDSDMTKKAFNLSCRDTVTKSKNIVAFELWGNRIFWCDCETKSFYFCFCGYSTNTTKSRLNALLHHFNYGGFYQKNWDIFWTNRNNNIKVDTSKTYKIIVSDSVVNIEAINESF